MYVRIAIHSDGNGTQVCRWACPAHESRARAKKKASDLVEANDHDVRAA